MSSKSQKNLFYRTDFLILTVLVILAAAMSGTSIGFSSSETDLTNQTSSILPYVSNGKMQTLQLNSLKFKNNQPSSETLPLKCPKKEQPAAPPGSSATTYPPIQCPICNNDGSCTMMTLNMPWCAHKDCSECHPVSPAPTQTIIPITPAPVVK